MIINVNSRDAFLIGPYNKWPLGAGSWMAYVDLGVANPDKISDYHLNRRLFSFPEHDSELPEDCDCGGVPPPYFNIPPPPPFPEISEFESEIEENWKDYNKITDNNVKVDQKKKFQKKIRTKAKDDSNQYPFKIFNKMACEGKIVTPEATCPAIFIAGDAHIRPRIHPPVAALLVAVATFSFVFVVTALVCWRYRKRRNGPTMIKLHDLTNGSVIYDDLPTGPTPRLLSSRSQDNSCTLGAMELLDYQLSPTDPHSSNRSHDLSQREVLLRSNSFMSPSNHDCTYKQRSRPNQDSSQYQKRSTQDLRRSKRFRDRDIFSSIREGSKPKKKDIFCDDFNDFTPDRDGRFSDRNCTSHFDRKRSKSKDMEDFPRSKSKGSDLFSVSNHYDFRDLEFNGSLNPFSSKKSEIGNFKDGFENFRNASQPRPPDFEYKDGRQGYNEADDILVLNANNQDSFNPTYEEISSDSVSGHSTQSQLKSAHPYPMEIELAPPYEAPDGTWICEPKKKLRRVENGDPKSTDGHKDISEVFPLNMADTFQESEYEAPFYASPIVPFNLSKSYRVPSTSDGRTSTSSSSEHPPESKKESKYYITPSISSSKSSTTPDTNSEEFPHSKVDLPPLPSRSDRYRMFLTLDRKNQLPPTVPSSKVSGFSSISSKNLASSSTSGKNSFKTLNLVSSRKRNKSMNLDNEPDSEPLYQDD